MALIAKAVSPCRNRPVGPRLEEITYANLLLLRPNSRALPPAPQHRHRYLLCPASPYAAGGGSAVIFRSLWRRTADASGDSPISIFHDLSKSAAKLSEIVRWGPELSTRHPALRVGDIGHERAFFCAIVADERTRKGSALFYPSPYCRRLRQRVVTLIPSLAAACSRVGLSAITRIICLRSKSFSLGPCPIGAKVADAG